VPPPPRERRSGKRCGATRRPAKRRDGSASLLDRNFFYFVELRELTGEVLLAFHIQAILIRSAALRCCFAVPAVQLIHDIHPFDHLSKRREPHGVETVVVAVIDEDL